MDSTSKSVSVSPVVTGRERQCVVGDWERERPLVVTVRERERPCFVGDWERETIGRRQGERERPCVVGDWERDHVWWVTGRETIGG